MAHDTIAAGRTICPDRAELAAFNTGRLPSPRLEALAEHLSRCPQCESSLQALQNEDTVQGLLRQPVTAVTPADEAACQRLEDRARAIPRRDADAATVSLRAGVDAGEGLPLPRAFGAYLLLKKLGQGGMGIVYQARQETLKRLIALKVVLNGVFASDEERARFRREGEALARVRHANVVQIYELGECQGQLFYAMEWLEGGTLKERLDGRTLPEREAAQLLATLARSVQALHDKDIVHRDLKPGNILFAADGTPKIADFGLVKLLDSADVDTRSCVVLGTVAYMPPEQARGSRDIGKPADVYALGVILYQALTGRTPFQSVSALHTLELLQQREVQPPSRHRPKLDRVLEAICLECLQKEPDQRYASAAALADDLERWLNGEPTQVRPPSRAARIGRMVRRHPRTVAGIGLLLLLLSLSFALLYLKDPERKLRILEAKLHRGEPVTLIQEKGGPIWFDWGIRQGSAGPSLQRGDAFGVSGFDPTILTLLRDPQGDYQFSAEVRHEDDSSDARVGLCFLHSRHATSEGLQHCFCTLTFNDFVANAPDPKSGRMSSRVLFSVYRVPETGPLSRNEWVVTHFPPAALETPGHLPWRQLKVAVRSEGIETFWEGRPFLHVSHQEIQDTFAPLRLVLVGDEMVNPFVDLRPAFTPHDAVGLFLYHGRASFRDVRIEPLAQP